MRQLFKNDIIRLAKDIKDIKNWSVYFLLYKDEIVYVGCSETPYARMYSHTKKFHIDKYHFLNFSTKEEALEAETYYIKSFKPIQNTLHNDELNKEERENRNKDFNDLIELKRLETGIKKNKAIEENKIKAKLSEDQKLTDIKNMFEESEKEKVKKLAELKEMLQYEIYESNDIIKIPKNSYIKKQDVFYLRIEDVLIKSKIQSESIIYKNKKYNKPTKLFGNIKELIDPNFIINHRLNQNNQK